MQIRTAKPVLLSAALILAASFTASSQKSISPPKIGDHTVGDDYFLANYTQLLDYWNKLAKESDRIKLVEIGKTAEGRPIIDGDHHLARQPTRTWRATKRSRSAWRAPKN